MIRSKVQLILYALMVFLVSSCTEDTEEQISKVNPIITLATSTDYVEVDEFSFSKEAVRLDWTAPADQGAEFKPRYVLKIDLADNDFRTAVTTDTLPADVTSKSFTHQELQTMLINKWGRTAGQKVDLDVKIVAIYQGPRFIPSEVKTQRISVKSFAPMAINADKIYIKGSAVADPAGIVLTRAVENPNLYAYYGELDAGKVVFPLEYNSKKDFMLAAPTGSTYQDGSASAVRPFASTADANQGWTIPAKANYRVVVNIADRTVTFYSPAKDKAVIEQNIYMHGPATSSNWTVANAERLVQSVANPNIWTYYNATVPLKTGDGRIKFINARIDGGFAYSANEAVTNITQGIQMTVFAGRDYRNSYYKVITTGMNLIILDLENLTVQFDKR